MVGTYVALSLSVCLSAMHASSIHFHLASSSKLFPFCASSSCNSISFYSPGLLACCSPVFLALYIVVDAVERKEWREAGRQKFCFGEGARRDFAEGTERRSRRRDKRISDKISRRRFKLGVWRGASERERDQLP